MNTINAQKINKKKSQAYHATTSSRTIKFCNNETSNSNNLPVKSNKKLKKNINSATQAILNDHQIK